MSWKEKRKLKLMADAMDPKVDYMSLDVPKIFAFTLVELCIWHNGPKNFVESQLNLFKAKSLEKNLIFWHFFQVFLIFEVTQQHNIQNEIWKDVKEICLSANKSAFEQYTFFKLFDLYWFNTDRKYKFIKVLDTLCMHL